MYYFHTPLPFEKLTPRVITKWSFWRPYLQTISQRVSAYYRLVFVAGGYTYKV
jgi:hypothetical protein